MSAALTVLLPIWIALILITLEPMSICFVLIPRRIIFDLVSLHR